MSEEIKKIDEKEETSYEMTQDELNNLISKTVDEMLVAKFQEKAEEQREKILENKEVVNEKTKTADEKTKEFFKALFNDDREQLKALTTSSSDTPKAGYTIPTELMNEVLRFSEVYGLARRKMRYLPFTGAGNSRTIPKLGSSVSVYWTDEGVAKTSTQPVFDKVTQTLKKLAAIVPMTEELLEDTGINLTALIGELIAEEVAKAEDTQFLAGTGSPWTGVLNNANCVQHAITATSIANLTADDLLNLTDKITGSKKVGAEFYWHPSITSIIRKLKDDQKRYILEGPSAGKPGTVWGFNYNETEVLPGLTDDAANKKFIFFGNLNKCAILGDKQQIQVKILDQATITDTDGETAINLAEQDMVALRFVERVGYVLALPEGISVLKTGTSGS